MSVYNPSMLGSNYKSGRFLCGPRVGPSRALAQSRLVPVVATRSACASISIRFRASCTRSPTASDSGAVVIADRLNNQATPWLMLAPEVDDVTGDKLERFYSLADGQILRLNRKKSLKVPDTARCFASTRGSWLAYADTKDGSLYLSNPFLNQVVELPPLGTIPSVLAVEHKRERDPNSDSSNFFNVTVKRFKVAFPDYDTTWDESPCYSFLDPASMANSMIRNLALSRDYPCYMDCVAMAIQGEMSRLAYSHIGKQFNPTAAECVDLKGGCTMNDGTFWTGLQEGYFPGGCTSNQVVYCSKNNLFYSLFDDVGIQSFDVERDRGQRSKKVSQFWMINLRQQLDREFFEDEQGSEALKEVRSMCKTKYYLLTLKNGDLLLIVRHYLSEGRDSGCIPPYKTLHFDVFRVSYGGELERVSCLQDRAIFIGWNQSFCIKAGASPGVKPNSIYYTDDLRLNVKTEWGHDNGVFSMSDGVISPCYPYHDEDEEKQVPITAPLFWVAPVSPILLCFANKGFSKKDGVLPLESCVEG